MDLETEQLAAKQNFDRLVKSFPFTLSTREEKFAIQIQQSKKNPFKKLEALYFFMDELLMFTSKYTPCRKGCSFCCHYAVSISEIEIAYIESKENIKRNKNFLPKNNFHGIACPFLKDGKCSIYKSRPFVCRKHVVLTNTNTWCKPEISNSGDFPILRFTSIDESFDIIRNISESYDVYDIRQCF